ncbi:DNA polymerase alpha-associated DNA helicase A [Thraustotheca clavata]|uniref:DNA helicase n=1 Tax=Thraustotheca clavata TaxID=74557 RepID=A0A1W0AB30_9STRA|nr:DNA polymerase alpha-associated DNA helicase A [Thraustotheca clavata]
MKAQVSLEKWLDSARDILQQERQAEIEQSKLENDTLPVQLNPNVLLNLILSSASTGLFGRTVLVLKLSFDRVLPSHHFGIGDLVQLSILTTTSTDESPKGIVTKVQENAITLAFEDLDDSDIYLNQSLRLDRLVNDATYRKLNEGIDRLAKYTDGPAMPILNVVFHGAEPQANPIQKLDSPNAATMNPSQIEAIQYAIASKDIALIHGPPGTGKTTTVVELITHCVLKQKMKILVCAPSNIAVDNVLEKLAATKPKFRMTRVGHPARLLPQVLHYCLDARIQSSDGTQIVSDIRKEMTSLQSKMAKQRKQKNKSGVYEMRKECQLLRKEIRERERKVVGEIIQHSDVIFATNAGASTKLLKDMVFDLVIIDEAAQALEASCWIPLLMGKRCVLAGDHLQLPPTIKSDEAARKHMTLFDRITKMDSTKHVVKMLSTQYRMHADISNWASNAMYDGKLESSQAVATRKICQLSHVNHTTELTDATLLLLDTAGCELEEDEEDASAVPLLQMSKSNKGEANVVVQHVKALLSIGLNPVDIAVITPYNAQVQLLKQLLLTDYPTLEIRSVDGFQGCEKEAVVMSLVRSNAKKQVGFLADDRRMNVAITRAKRHVALICDTDTVSNHPFLKNLVEYFEAHGEYRSAEEYIENDSTLFDSKALLAEIQHTESQTVVKETIVPKPSHKPQNKAKKASATQQTVQVHATPPKPPSPQTQENKIPLKSVSSPKAKLTTSDAPLEVKDDSITKSSNSNTVETSMATENAESTSDQEEEQIPEEKVPSAFGLLMDDSSSSDEEVENTLEEAPPTNSLLKNLHNERVARQVAAKVATQAPKASQQTSSKKKKKKKGKEAVRVQAVDEKVAEEDDLAFLNRVASKANNCSFLRCKQNTSLMGSICRFCNLKFCYNHGQPEVHGCGDAVRTFERERAALQSTPIKSQSYQSKEKRKLLQKALDTKIAAKTSDRKTKAKSKQ